MQVLNSSNLPLELYGMLCTGKKMQFYDDIAPRCTGCGAGAGGGVGAVRRTRYISGAIIDQKTSIFLPAHIPFYVHLWWLLLH